jgi:hypothetical protein
LEIESAARERKAPGQPGFVDFEILATPSTAG